MARRSLPVEKPGLSEAQQAAINCLLAGKSDQESAESVGVDRATVAAWRTRDNGFIAESNRRRLDLWGAQIERLRGLVSLAVGALESDLKNTEDPRLRQAAAVHILKAVKLYGDIPDPDDRVNPDRMYNFDL